ISPELVERIRAMAAEMNYRPNMAARQLVGKGTRLVGVIVRQLIERCDALQAQAVSVELFARNFSAFLCHTHGRPELLRRCGEECGQRGVEGVIGFDPQGSIDVGLKKLLAETVPWVIHACPSVELPYLVAPDIRQAGRLA